MDSIRVIECEPEPYLNENENDICKDYDSDCDGSFCAVDCWLYQPERGICPLLQEPE